MKVTQIEVRNFRSISNVSGLAIETGSITAIAGANDSGKSAFLLGSYLGFMGLFGFPKARDITYSRYIGLTNKHVSQDQTTGNSDSIMVRIKIVFDMMDLRHFLSKAESWTIRGRTVLLDDVIENLQGIECVFDVDVDALFDQNGRVVADATGFQRWFSLEATVPWLRNAFTGRYATGSERDAFLSDLLANFSKQMQWNSIPVQVLYIPAERYVDPSQWQGTQQFEYQNLVDFRLGVEPRELLQYVASLEVEGNQRLYAQFIQLLNMLYPINEVRIRGTAFGNDIFIAQGLRSHPLSRSGTGIAQVMYVCARTIAASTNSDLGLTVILFDEPETGLHPGLQRSLIKLLNSMVDTYRVQWILGSHSPFIFNEIDTSCDQRVWAITHDSQKSTVRSVDHPDAVKELYANIGLHLPSILTAKALLLCEGISETKFLPEALRKVGIDVRLQSIVIVPFGGIGNLKYMTPKDLQLLHPRIMLVLDWDDGETVSNQQRECFHRSDIEVYCNKEYRNFENSYPAEAVARAFGCEKVPQIGSRDDFDAVKRSISEANPSKPIPRKARMAEKVALAMTEQECREHPLVQSIMRWIERSFE